MARVLDRGGKIIDMAPSRSFLLHCTFTKIGGEAHTPLLSSGDSRQHVCARETRLYMRATQLHMILLVQTGRNLTWCDDNPAAFEKKVSTGRATQYNWAVLIYFLLNRSSKNAKNCDYSLHVWVSQICLGHLWHFKTPCWSLGSDNRNLSLFPDSLPTKH